MADYLKELRDKGLFISKNMNNGMSPMAANIPNRYGKSGKPADSVPKLSKAPLVVINRLTISGFFVC